MPGAVAFDVHREREPLQGRVGDLPAVHFLIEKVTPAADCLGERKTRHDAVGNAEKIDLMNEAEENNAECAADNAADDGQTAVAESREPFGNGCGRVGHDGEGARADDAERQNA